jgi:hypothetical protein
MIFRAASGLAAASAELRSSSSRSSRLGPTSSAPSDQTVSRAKPFDAHTLTGVGGTLSRAMRDALKSGLPKSTTRTLAVVGAGTLVALGALSAGLDIPPSPPFQAGSGHGAKNTIYNQPVVRDMNLGATAKWTTPPPVPQITRATPAGGAH